MMALAVLAATVLSAPPTDAALVTPWLQPPSNWMMVYVGSPDHETAELVPVLRWTHDETGQVQEKRLTAVKPGSSRLRVVQGPELGGPWTVQLVLTHGPDEVSVSETTGVRVIGLWSFFLLLMGLFAALIASVLVSFRGNNKTRLIVAGSLLITGWMWVPMIMAGYTLFGLLFGLLTGLAVRFRDVPAQFLTVASIVIVIFGELYWGAITNGTFWTAPVISLTLLWFLWRGLGLIFRGDKTLAWATWAGALVVCVLYITLNVYKAFFLDYPSIAVSGDAGQLGRVWDSISHVFRVTHVMGLLLPLGVLATYLVMRRRVT